MGNNSKNLRNFFTQENPFLDAMQPGSGLGFISAEYSQIPLFNDLEITEETILKKEKSSLRQIRYRYVPALIELEVVYEFFHNTNVLEISGVLRNGGPNPLHRVKGPFSLALEFNLSQIGPLKMSNLFGGKEVAACYPPPAYHITRADGVYHVVGGIHGGRSTETEAPYAIVTNREETYGFFYAYEWPGRWIFNNAEPVRNGQRFLSLFAHVAEVETDLMPGETLYIPRAVLGFFHGNWDAGSNLLRRHVMENVRRPLKNGTLLPPVFYNHWFGHGNQFDAELLKQEARVYADLGCEYFVVDTGWHKDGFRSGIGNWEIEDVQKFPQGMAAFADFVRSLGMKFGTWLEIEFAMKHSDWGKRHADWFYSAPGCRDFVNHKRAYEEVLLKLDDANVRNSVLDFLVRFVEKYNLEWIRWDFNNSPAQFLDANEKENEWGKLQNAYGAGLFRLLDDFMEACPQVHMEACAGGGHRMDLGTLRRAHSCWMSDNAAGYEAVRRYQINMNRFLGPNYSNSVFLWAKGCHEKGFRYDFSEGGCPTSALRSKMAGPLGFSEPSWFYTELAKAFLKKEIAAYKKLRHLLMKDFYPLFEPRSLADFDGWQVHDPETGEGMFMLFRCNSPDDAVEIHLKGLEDGLVCSITNLDSSETQIRIGSAPFRVRIAEREGTAWFHYEKNLKQFIQYQQRKERKNEKNESK